MSFMHNGLHSFTLITGLCVTYWNKQCCFAPLPWARTHFYEFATLCL